ncbi:MAG: CapA family protein [Anaerovibrio sp.]|uniref:CapA family protein n=1 Tax=Anaerovibrio sp. TaxID=1872532 RepID=UPI0025F17923|nr:CapA family protein [Anaerovibrio sp.]MCR5177278.1 CapA family protein [Anaerovibrio sp.]
MRKLLVGVLFLTVVVVNTFIVLITVNVVSGNTSILFGIDQPRQSEKADAAPLQTTEKKQKDTVTVSFAGDCTLGSFKGSDKQFANYYAQNGADYFLANVRGIFMADDITFVNLEGPLTANPQVVEKQFSMRGEPWYVDILKGSGVNVCNLANNHIMDCGEKGFADTINLLKQNGINFCGEQHIAQMEINGAKVCFLGYHGWENNSVLRQQISADIKVCREGAKGAIVCVQFHWGEEGAHYPNETQRSLAHFAVDSGADCVLGTHPHVIQGVEKYRGKVIAYSLGNFCFGANNNPSDKDSFILQQTFRSDGKIVKTEIIPCRISSRLDTNDFRPVVLSGSEGNRVIDRLKQYSSPFDETIDCLR